MRLGARVSFGMMALAAHSQTIAALEAYWRRSQTHLKVEMPLMRYRLDYRNKCPENIGMIFTRLGTIIAYIGVGLGILRVAMGFFIATMFDDANSYAAASRRYLGSASTGEAIDTGIICIVVSVALGVLCEVSKSRKTDAG